MSRDMNPADWLGANPKKLPGQKANDAKVKERWEVQATADRLAEASKMANDVLDWINERAAATGIDAEQRIFAVALAAVNLRNTFPSDHGGLATFDRVAEVAWEYFERTATRLPHTEYEKRLKPQGLTVTTDPENTRTKPAAALTNEVIQFLNDIALGRGLDPEQRIFGASLIVISMRYHLPPEMGGKEFFDEVAKMAATYYKANGG